MRAVCAPKCLEKDAHADFLCLHCYPNAVGDNTWAYFKRQDDKGPVVVLEGGGWKLRCESLASLGLVLFGLVEKTGDIVQVDT